MDLFWIGMGLGVAAGFSPGPLLTLVISSTLARGFGAGLRVALAPLITDAPIILLTLVVLRNLPDVWLALIGALGGGFVVYLGMKSLQQGKPSSSPQEDQGGEALDLGRGALVNLLNPHPWVFWTTVQGPLFLAGWRQDPWNAVAFVAAFYIAIVGSKVSIAALVARGRGSLDERWYRRSLIVCGVLLITLGLTMIYQAALRLA